MISPEDKGELGKGFESRDEGYEAGVTTGTNGS